MRISESIKTAFFTVLFIFVLLYVFAKVLGPIPFAVNSVSTTKTDMFTVSGVGEVNATAESAQFSVGVTKTATTAEEAKNQANTVVNTVIDSLKKLGIEEKDIKTASVTVNPNYNFSTGRETINGYTATTTLDVKADTVEVANQAIDAVTIDGVNVVNGVQFTFDEEKKKELTKEATKKAIDDAKKKAQEIAGLSGLKLGRIVNVQVSEGGTTPPMLYQANDAVRLEAKAEPTDLQPGENTVSSSVTLSYETL